MDFSLERMGRGGRVAAFLVVAVLIGFRSARAAEERVTLEEPVTDSRVYSVSTTFKMDGQFQTPVRGGKAQAWKANAAASFKFLERRLPGTGRGADAYRSLRNYDEAESKITVEKEVSSLRLRDRRRLIVASGRREGVVPYSPNGPLTRNELELLQMVGDNLAVLGLLPVAPVAVGEKWEPDSWVAQTLANVEAVQTSKLTCELQSVLGGVARVKFDGNLVGATVGAHTEITLSGSYLYDVKQQHIKRVDFEHKEKRSVGTVSPGMDITVRVSVERKLSDSEGPLTEEAAEKIPLEPIPQLLLLTFQTPWNVELLHDRNWHVFRQSGDVAVLRLLEKGSLIAQCNLTRIPAAGAGKHTAESEFQADVQKILGERLKAIEKAEEVKTDDGRFLYRVTAVGETKDPAQTAPIPMTWIYYLCASPAGEQVSLVFAVETKLMEQLGNRDLAFVKSLTFGGGAITPASASK